MQKKSLTPQQYAFANLTGTDEYDRTVQVVDTKNPDSKKDRYVGIFYSGWLGTHMVNNKGRIYDVNKLEKQNPEALYALNHEESPNGTFHFSNEPLYGYYSMRDEWVVNRHIELLTMAGIDYLMIDTSNAIIYYDAVKNLIKIISQYKAQGWKVPRISFYTNSHSALTITTLMYEYYYNADIDSSIWFRFDDDVRPVIVGVSTDNNSASDWFEPYPEQSIEPDNKILKYFNFFEAQWPNSTKPHLTNGMPWMATWDNEPKPNGTTGNMAASVIQHNWESVFASDMIDSASRGYYGNHKGKNPDWRRGDNLEWQITSARKYFNDGTGRNLIITGWNEWMAIKNPNGPTLMGWKNMHGGFENFVDSYNAEYSRDIEMGKEYGDNFYMQLARHVREIKYSPCLSMRDDVKTTIDITDLSAWDKVKTEYADFVGDAIARDGENAANVPHAYIDNSNRNDIASIKIAHDDENLYVCVSTAELDEKGKVVDKDITKHVADDKGWMNLMLGTGGENSFIGFDYIINRFPNEKTGKTSIERCTAPKTYAWKNVGEADYFVNGNKIAYKIPLTILGLDKDNVSFTFKVTDNVLSPEDPMSYYIYGDSAPIGRNGYAYNKLSTTDWE